jgi:hypothetical protein
MYPVLSLELNNITSSETSARELSQTLWLCMSMYEMKYTGFFKCLLQIPNILYLIYNNSLYV